MKWKGEVIQKSRFGSGCGKKVYRPGRESLPRACLLGQAATDINDVVGDHPEPDPAPDAVRFFIERSP